MIIRDSFTIEKGVPVPEANRDKRRWPWEQLAVGDCLFVAVTDAASRRTILNRASVSAYLWGKKNHARFTCRSVPDGVRVWRIA